MRRFPNPVVFKRTSRSLTSAMFRKHASASTRERELFRVEQSEPRVLRRASDGTKKPARFPPVLVVPPRRSGFLVPSALRAVVQEQRARDAGELGVVQGEPVAGRAPSVPRGRGRETAGDRSARRARARTSRAFPRGQGARGPRSGARPRTATRTGRGRPWDRARPCCPVGRAGRARGGEE